MSVTVDLFQPRAQDGQAASWFANMWVARDGTTPVGALQANAGGTISLVAVHTDYRGRGISELLVNAARHTLRDQQLIDADELTYAYPISEAGERFVAKHEIPLYVGRHSDPFSCLETSKAELLAAELLANVGGTGERIFPAAPVLADIPADPPAK